MAVLLMDLALVSLSDSMSALALVSVLDSKFHRLALVLVLALGSMLEASVTMMGPMLGSMLAPMVQRLVEPLAAQSVELLDSMWATLVQLLAALSVELLAAQLVVAWLAQESLAKSVLVAECFEIAGW